MNKYKLNIYISIRNTCECGYISFFRKFRVDSRLAPSQWETSLQSNAVSHWLGANLESALDINTWQQLLPHQIRGHYIHTLTQSNNSGSSYIPLIWAHVAPMHSPVAMIIDSIEWYRSCNYYAHEGFPNRFCQIRLRWSSALCYQSCKTHCRTCVVQRTTNPKLTWFCC